jgi:hypothetical protein
MLSGVRWLGDAEPAVPAVTPTHPPTCDNAVADVDPGTTQVLSMSTNNRWLIESYILNTLEEIITCWKALPSNTISLVSTRT